MNRGAVLTLGLLAALGGVVAARGDDLSSWNWPSLPFSSSGMLPTLPQNWADLPLQFHINETVGYNNNVTNTPTGPSAAGFQPPIGAWEMISTYGVTYKQQISGQELFADANWGMYRYLNHGEFNTAHNALDAGDNFTLGSRCKGTLKASEVTTPSLPGQQIGFNVINNTTTTDFTENAKCLINGEFTGIFNSGTERVTNSATVDQQNDYRSVFVAAGISYAVSNTNTFELLGTLTGIDFTDRQDTVDPTTFTGLGLVNQLTTDELMATYTRSFGPNLAVTAKFGLLGASDSYMYIGMPRTVLPEYVLSAQWAATPKLTLNASASRLASPPSAVLSNLQVTDSGSVGFSYRCTSKVTLSGELQAAYITGGATANGSNPTFTNGQDQRTYSANASVAYAVTPFVTTNLTYQFYRTIQPGLTTNSSSILLALNFNPY